MCIRDSYIHGNLYEKDYGNACAVPKNTTVQDHRLQFSEWDVSYPVVKIGPGYWTRTYITRKMQFGVKGAGGRFMTKEEVVDGILFADIYQTNSTGFLFPNEEIFGQHTEAYYGKQTLWYLPLTRDRKHLICLLYTSQDSRFSFSNTDKSNTSLVKIYYVNNVPVLEICEEYVPKIRSDQRIQVFYPIYLGKTNHSQGLFPGDGEGNRPASIAFYEGDCYVTPIEEYGTCLLYTSK